MQRQEEKVFKKILDDNKYSIYRICRIYTVPPVEAQDLFQEVVFQIWKSLPNFKGKSNVSTWVYKIALNGCARSKNRLKKGNINTVRLESVEFKSSEFIPDTDQNEKYNALITTRDLCLNGRLLISQRCHELIDEFQHLEIDPKTEQPKDGYDDLIACVRYIIMTYDYCLGKNPVKSPQKTYYEDKIDNYWGNKINQRNDSNQNIFEELW